MTNCLSNGYFNITLFQVLLFVIGLIMMIVGIALLPAVNGIVLAALGGTIATAFLCVLCCRVGCSNCF